MKDVTITNLSDLNTFNESLPDGTMSEGRPSDLDAGNFDEVSMQLPNGEEFTVRYTGPVQDA